MSKNNETTTKFKVDISELKKNFQEASRQIKLANSEFKAATSGMDSWGTSADGIGAKLTQLNSVCDAQKTQLASLEKQYELTVKEQGENSRGAQELMIKINNQKSAIGETEKQIRNYNAKLTEMKAETGKTETASSKLGETIKKQQGELDAVKEKYKNLVLEQGAESAAAKEAAQEIGTLSSELHENKTKLESADKAADKLDNSIEDVGEQADKTTNGGLNAFGVALGNLISGVVKQAIGKMKELAVETVNVGKQFDSSMSKVKAISGVTGEEYEELRQKAKEMGATTKFSATEASEAYEYMGMAGWKSKQMLDGIDGVLNLAAASGEDLATTSDIVTDALTAFGLEAGEAGRFADVLAATSANANTNVSLMGESFKYVAPVAGAMGYTVEDMSTAIGTLGNNGIKGAQAGTTLRKAIANLISPSGEAEKAMQKLGFYASETIDTFDQQKIDDQMLKVEKASNAAEKAQISYNSAVAKYGEDSAEAEAALNSFSIKQKELAIAEEKLDKLKKGEVTTLYTYNKAIQNEDGSMKSFSETVDFLREALNGKSEADKAAAVSTLFGTQAMSGMLAIVNTTDEDMQKLSTAINNCDGAAKTMADTMLNNLGGDMTLLSSKLEGVQLAIYEKFEPALRDGVKVLDKVLDAVQYLVDHGRESIAVITGIGAAFAAWKIAGVITAITTALAGMSAAEVVAAAKTWLLNTALLANPIGLLISLLAGLVAAFVVLWKKCDWFREFWIGAWESIKEKAEPVVEWLFAKFKELWEYLQPYIEKAKELLGSLWESIKEKAGPIVEWLFAMFKELWERMPQYIEEAKELLDSALKEIREMFAAAWGAISAVWDLVQPYFQAIWNKIKAIFSAVAPVLGKYFSAAWEIIKVVWNVAVKYFTLIWKNIIVVYSAVKETFKAWFTAAWDSIKVVWDLAVGYFKMIWNNIKLVFSVVENVLHGDFSGAWEAIKKIWDNTSGYFSKAWDGIKRIFSNVKNFFKIAFSEAWNAVKGVFKNVGEFFGGVWDTIKGKFTTIGTLIGEAIGGAFKLAINAVIATVENGINFIPEAINNALGLINDLPGVDIPSMPTISLPRLYKGGVLKKGQLGLLEGSGAEAVVPLEKNTGWLDEIAARLYNRMELPRPAAVASAGTTVVNNFYQTNNSPKALSRLEIYRQSKNLLRMKR